MEFDFREIIASQITDTLLPASQPCLLSPDAVRRRAPPPPPPPIMNTAPAPTATITATPSVVNPGAAWRSSWHTTDANDISIEGIGEVPCCRDTDCQANRVDELPPVAHGDGGSTDATARVTVNVRRRRQSARSRNRM